VVSDSKSLFRSILNIWVKPAENFAMLANRGQEIFVEASLRQEKQEESVLKGSPATGCFANSGKTLDCESSGNRGFDKEPRRRRLGEHVLESLVAHRLIDLGNEWHLHRHRYEHIVHGRFTW
jgi:hypothetical protein